MRAIRFHRYGPPGVLRWEEAPDPVPGRGEVRVRVRAAALNPKDALVRKGKLRLFTGWQRFPLASGYDLAGVVDALGPGVRSVAAGDAVFSMIQSWRAGACAELAVVPERELARKPASLSMTEAAAVPLAASTALQALRDLLHVRAGDEVVLNGASGGVGVFAIQIAKILGARAVAVCSRKNAGAGHLPRRRRGPPLRRGAAHRPTTPLRRHLRHLRQRAFPEGRASSRPARPLRDHPPPAFDRRPVICRLGTPAGPLAWSS